MFLSKILIHSCIIIIYIVEKIFLSLSFTSFQYRKNIKNVIWNKINRKQRIIIIMPKEANMLNSKIMKEK